MILDSDCGGKRIFFKGFLRRGYNHDSYRYKMNTRRMFNSLVNEEAGKMLGSVQRHIWRVTHLYAVKEC